MNYVTFNEKYKYAIEDLNNFNIIVFKPMSYEESDTAYAELKDLFITSVDFSSDDGMFSGHYDNLTMSQKPQRTINDNNKAVITVYTKEMTESDKTLAQLAKKYDDLLDKYNTLETRYNQMVWSQENASATSDDTTSETVTETDTATTESAT